MTVYEKKLLKILKAAISNRRLTVYYQPQYDTATNMLVGAEALARLVDDGGTVICAEEFIPLAEESGVILELDWYVLEEICGFMHECRERGHQCSTISVNFSGKHVDEVDFLERLCTTVDAAKIDRKLLVLEFTEATVLGNPEEMEKLIEVVRAEGFKVALDHFGRKYSSLTFFRDLKIDIIKIDKALFAGNCQEESERWMLTCVFDLANRLNLITVAEGVETREQLGFLRTCACKMVQGYTFSEPLPQEQFFVVCSQTSQMAPMEDILQQQPLSTSRKMLLDAIFQQYPLVMIANLTRDSFIVLANDNFSAAMPNKAGSFEENLRGGAYSMHEDDRELFLNTFSREALLDAYHRGEKCVRLVTRQLGSDGVYRKTETADYFVKNSASQDVLVVIFCRNI